MSYDVYYYYDDNRYLIPLVHFNGAHGIYYPVFN